MSWRDTNPRVSEGKKHNLSKKKKKKKECVSERKKLIIGQKTEETIVLCLETEISIQKDALISYSRS